MSSTDTEQAWQHVLKVVVALQAAEDALASPSAAKAPHAHELQDFIASAKQALRRDAGTFAKQTEGESRLNCKRLADLYKNMCDATLHPSELASIIPSENPLTLPLQHIIRDVTPMFKDFSDEQAEKDIVRDRIVINGKHYIGRETGYAGVLCALQDVIFDCEKRLTPDAISTPTAAKALLKIANRTVSGGDSLEAATMFFSPDVSSPLHTSILSFLENRHTTQRKSDNNKKDTWDWETEGADDAPVENSPRVELGDIVPSATVLVPDAAVSPPIAITIDVGPAQQCGGSTQQLDSASDKWSFGVRARIEATTVYRVYASAEELDAVSAVKDATASKHTLTTQFMCELTWLPSKLQADLYRQQLEGAGEITHNVTDAELIAAASLCHEEPVLERRLLQLDLVEFVDDATTRDAGTLCDICVAGQGPRVLMSFTTTS